MIRLFKFIKPLAPYLLVVWVIIILIFSSISKLPALKIITDNVEIRLDYLFHFLEYSALALLTILTFAKSEVSIKSSRVALLLLGLLIFASADEAHQLLIPNRAFQLFDLMADIIGILTGTIVTLWLNRR